MAKIKGLQLKAYKSFEGREGYGFSANLYYKNKKVAFCFDSADGGEMDIDWLNNDKNLKEEIKTISEKYLKENELVSSDNPIHSQGYIANMIEELIRLSDIEKVLKKKKKQNPNGFVVYLRYIKANTRAKDIDFSNYKEDDILSGNDWNEEIEKLILAKYKPVEYEIYTKLEDFIKE